MITRRMFVQVGASFGVLWAKMVQAMEPVKLPVLPVLPVPDTPDKELLWGQDLLWGTYGKDGKQGLRIVSLGNCCTDHLLSIIGTQRMHPDYARAIADIIKHRLRHGNDPVETHGHSKIVTQEEFERIVGERYTKITGRRA